MSLQGTIRRYSLLIEKINSSRYPSFQALKEYLNDHGFEISPRTLQRDIAQIKYEFSAEIKYNRYENGYFIDKELSINLDSFLRFLEIAGMANLLAESIKDGKDVLNYLSFESAGNLKGLEYLKPLLFAIKNNRKVAFLHQSFNNGQTRKYILEPYLLKEYQGRWYLVGLPVNTDEFFVYGVDRITDVEVLATTFRRNTKADPVKLFDNIVGLTFTDKEPEEILISLTPLQGKYAKALPLHKSQVIMKDNKKEVILKITVNPNFELIQKILMMGNRAKVLRPKWFANKIIEELKGTFKKYKR